MDGILKGKLKRWNDDRGFGFIVPDNGNNEVFIHISALKNMSRRPVVGDMILYQLHTGNDGKSKAVNARIDGVSFTKTRSYYKNKKVKHNWIAKIIFIVILVCIGFLAYKKFTSSNQLLSQSHGLAGVIDDVARKIKKSETDYRCDGRTYCSEMTSCEEAEFFINHCPGTKMDGDGDGIPCESQWCSF